MYGVGQALVTILFTNNNVFMSESENDMQTLLDEFNMPRERISVNFTGGLLDEVNH